MVNSGINIFIWAPVLFILSIQMQAQINTDKNSGDYIRQSTQLILVESNDWDDTVANLSIYKRENNAADWEMIDSGVRVTIGRKGMSPGDGLIQYGSGIKKKEGDGKTPSGIFKLKFVFGYEEPIETRFIKMPYLMSNDQIECVDDPASAYYNQIIYRELVDEPDWKSSEEMRRKDHLYKWGIAIDYNTYSPKTGIGSCIFMHLWRDRNTATSGCTAMDEKSMLALLNWLDPKDNPIIIQCIEAESDKIKSLAGSFK